MHNSQWHSPNEHHEWTIHFQRKLKCQGYIQSASIMAWLSPFPPLPSACACVSRKQLIFSISKLLIKKCAWLSSITLFFSRCLSLFLIPWKFHSSLIILPHWNCFHHQHKMLMALWMPSSFLLACSLFLFLSLAIRVCMCPKSDSTEKQQSIYWIRSIRFILVFILYCLCMHWTLTATHFLRFLVFSWLTPMWNTFGWAFILLCPTEAMPLPYTIHIYGQQSKIANNCR